MEGKWLDPRMGTPCRSSKLQVIWTKHQEVKFHWRIGNKWSWKVKLEEFLFLVYGLGMGHEGFWSDVGRSKLPSIKINLEIYGKINLIYGISGNIVRCPVYLLGYLVCKQWETQLNRAWSTRKFIILFKRCLESWLVISASAFCPTAPLLSGFEGCTQHSSLEKEVAAVSKSLSHNQEHPEGEETIPSWRRESRPEIFPFHLIGQSWVTCPGLNQSLIRRMALPCQDSVNHWTPWRTG